MSTTSQLAASLYSGYRKVILVFDVGDFPPDMRHTLQRPLLAQLDRSVSKEKEPVPECKFPRHSIHFVAGLMSLELMCHELREITVRIDKL